MTDATFVLNDFTSFDRRPLSRRHSSRTVVGAAAAAAALVTGAWLLEGARHTATNPSPPRPVTAMTTMPADLPLKPRREPDAGGAPHLVFAFSLGVAPVPLERSTPLGSVFVPTVAANRAVPDEGAPAPFAAPVLAQVTRDVPLPEPALRDVPVPEPRPPTLRLAESRWTPAGRRPVRRDVASAAPAAPADNRGFLERFFGMLRPAGAALGYAAPEDGLLGNTRGAIFNPALAHDRWTAVYDIAAHTVTMPDGTRLEAHSGLGELLDDPRHVGTRNRGATPPHLYDLQPREQPFHGVRALRLNPVGGSGVFGRTGLLAHTYMLGPKGDSNGCVSFKDYNAFLQAFSRGEVKRLAVVAGLG